jgi:hypothetical protein
MACPGLAARATYLYFFEFRWHQKGHNPQIGDAIPQRTLRLKSKNPAETFGRMTFIIDSPHHFCPGSARNRPICGS